MSTISYNQYAPGGCFKQLSDAAGATGVPYSQYAPGGPAEQLRVYINPSLVLDQKTPGGVWGQAAVAVGVDLTVNSWEAAIVAAGGSVSAPRKALVKQLISGLTTDGVWDKLDRLWMLAAENSQSALADLVAASVATVVNAPGFTTDRGYTGNLAAQTCINTGFNPSTAPAAKFTKNSACMFCWCNTTGGEGTAVCGHMTADGVDYMYPRYSDNKFYAGLSDNNGFHGVTASDSIGLWLINRTSSSAITVDLNGVNLASYNANSIALANSNFAILQDTPGINTNKQVCCFGVGRQLTSADRVNLYNRLRTYMTAVGVP